MMVNDLHSMCQINSDMDANKIAAITLCFFCVQGCITQASASILARKLHIEHVILKSEDSNKTDTQFTNFHQKNASAYAEFRIEQ